MSWMNCVAIHSFRHTFISNIRNNHAFDLLLLQQIVGHELSKGGITDKYTHGGTSVKRLDEVVNAFSLIKLNSPSLILSVSLNIMHSNLTVTHLLLSDIITSLNSFWYCLFFTKPMLSS